VLCHTLILTFASLFNIFEEEKMIITVTSDHVLMLLNLRTDVRLEEITEELDLGDIYDSNKTGLKVPTTHITKMFSIF